MSEKKHQGANHEGEGHSAPYGLSRMAPTMTLVDVARQIQEADEQVGQATGNKLRLIAKQIGQLRQQAEGILEQAQRDLVLHRAACAFQRVPGQIYHLYEKADGSHQWSLLSVEDWGGRPPHRFRGSYRLEPDQTWTPIEQIDPEADDPYTSEAVLETLVGRPREPE